MYNSEWTRFENYLSLDLFYFVFFFPPSGWKVKWCAANEWVLCNFCHWILCSSTHYLITGLRKIREVGSECEGDGEWWIGLKLWSSKRESKCCWHMGLRPLDTFTCAQGKKKKSIFCYYFILLLFFLVLLTVAMILNPTYLPGKPEPLVHAKSKSFSTCDMFCAWNTELFDGRVWTTSHCYHTAHIWQVLL